MCSISGLGHWQCNNEHFRLSVAPLCIRRDCDFPCPWFSSWFFHRNQAAHPQKYATASGHRRVHLCICAFVHLRICGFVHLCILAWPNVVAQVKWQSKWVSFCSLWHSGWLCGKLHPRPLLNISACTLAYLLCFRHPAAPKGHIELPGKLASLICPNANSLDLAHLARE